MLFHVTITHSQADCPGRRPADTPELIGPTERLEALGDELSVTSHSLVWGASCILWAEPEHVAYALLEAPSLHAVEQYIDALTPAEWTARALPVFTLPTQLAAVRQVLNLPVMPREQPAVVATEPADEADWDDTLKEVVTVGQVPVEPPAYEPPAYEPLDTTPEPPEERPQPAEERPQPPEERPDQQITRAIPTPVFEPPVEPAAERPDQQITRAIPTPVFEPPVEPAAERPEQQITRAIPTPVFEPPVAPAAERPEQQITRAIPTPVFEEPVAPAAERPDQQITRAIPTPVFEKQAERPDQQVTREIPRPAEQPVAPADGGSSAVTRFIERPAVLDSLAGAPPRAEQPEPPAPAAPPRDPIPFSEDSTVILDSQAEPPALMQLVANSGPAQGSVFEVGEAGATLGRLPDNSISLTDGRLSRHHAQIDYRDGGYWLVDLASQNGTLVNDRPLTEPHRLQAGDSIELGTTRLTVLLDSED